MSLDALLRHTLVVKHLAQTTVPVHDPAGPTDGDPVYDGYGQPVTAEETLATVAGLVQPRRAREVELASQAGAVIGEHVGYVRPLAGLGTDCWVEVGGVRYDIVSMPDAAGLGHHLELGLKRVG